MAVALFEYVRTDEEWCGGAAMDYVLSPGMKIVTTTP